MKEKKYKYEWTVEETTTDTRVYTIRANKKLDEEELRDLACNVEEVPGEGYLEDDAEVIYEETIYGDDAHWDFTLHTTTASIEDELKSNSTKLMKILKVKDKGETNA
jgi:hypothetical protein